MSKRQTQWPAPRIRQLEKFRSLLREIRHLDSGSGALQRLRWIVKAAKHLEHDCLRRRTRSFLTFLFLEAGEEDRPTQIKRLTAENDKMRSALVDYHKTERAYEAKNSTERYGAYMAASKRLTNLAKELSEQIVF